MSILWAEESLLTSLLKGRPDMVGSGPKGKAAWRGTHALAQTLGQDSGWASGLVCWAPDPWRPLLGIGTWGDGCVCGSRELGQEVPRWFC